MTPNTFRALIVLYILLSIAAALTDILVPGLIPVSIAQAVENEPLPTLFGNPWIEGAVFIPIAIIIILSTIGLFFFKRWARSLAFYSTVFLFALNPLFGVTVTSGWASALYEASLIIWGAILALAYYSPVLERFAEKNTGTR